MQNRTFFSLYVLGFLVAILGVWYDYLMFTAVGNHSVQNMIVAFSGIVFSLALSLYKYFYEKRKLSENQE